MNTMKNSAHNQQGAMLLEALIAILIFSMGILAIIGLQTASIRLSGDAKYRMDANTLANRVIGRMWVDDRTHAQLLANYGNGASGVGYTTWLNEVQLALPGVSGVPANQPTIAVAPVAGTNVISSQVTVTVYWNLPGEPATSRHSAIVIAQIR